MAPSWQARWACSRLVAGVPIKIAWNVFYPILQPTLQQYGLNGIDLDVEENVSLANTEMLIN